MRKNPDLEASEALIDCRFRLAHRSIDGLICLKRASPFGRLLAVRGALRLISVDCFMAAEVKLSSRLSERGRAGQPTSLMMDASFP
ncbi:hypothetical protein D6B98_18860 [Bradyrhizobium sp. LVM 105]|nr:hypothetical protein D6B98_18860 [Bradyrhizobium sp. LVM 105]